MGGGTFSRAVRFLKGCPPKEGAHSKIGSGKNIFCWIFPQKQKYKEFQSFVKLLNF